MKEYKILFSGFAYVNADSEEEAEEMFWDDEDSCRDVCVDLVVEIGEVDDE